MVNLLIAGWSLTKMCNLRCMHCYNSSGKQALDELTTQEALDVCDKLKKSGVAAVNFGGGECALRKDFIDICKYLNKLDIQVSYTTNGTVFDLIKDNLNLFHDIGVSIDFADREKHDLFRGRNGTYDQAVSTIKNLVSANVNTEIVTCLTKLNCNNQEIERIIRLANELKVSYLRLNRFRSNGRGDSNKDALALSKDELREAYSLISTHLDESVSVPEPLLRAAYGGRYFFDGDPSGHTAFRIQHNGEVTPSVFLNISGGNIKDKPLEEILDSPIFHAIRERSPRGKCITCPSYSHCKGGDAGASYLAYGHFDGPDPLCWLENKDIRVNPKKQFSGIWNVHELYLCTVYVPINVRR